MVKNAAALCGYGSRLPKFGYALEPDHFLNIEQMKGIKTKVLPMDK